MAKKGKYDNLKYIKGIIDENRISTREIETIADIGYPLFSFRWLQEFSFHECTDEKFFHSFLLRLKKLSELGWKEIRKSGRHQFGMEKININQLKPKTLPQIITPDIDELDVFRASGDNRPMVGLQEGKIFHVIFIEANFGDVYNHC